MVQEPQACGCRVVTTDRPPMNDVGGDVAAYLVPKDIRSSLDVLLNMLHENDRQRTQRIERGFANAARYSTQAMIDNHMTLYEKVAGAQK